MVVSNAPVGFSGRTAIYEIVPVDEPLRRLIHGNAAEYELENHARRYAGSIRDDGLRKSWQEKPHWKKC